MAMAEKVLQTISHNNNKQQLYSTFNNLI